MKKREIVDGFVDATAMIRPGIFILANRGEVTYIGRANCDMIERIIALRPTERLPWLPQIQYDEIWIRAVHPDRIAAEYAALIAKYQPRHNLPRVKIEVVELIQ